MQCVSVSFLISPNNNLLHVCFLFEIRSMMIGAQVETKDMGYGTRRVESQEIISNQGQKREKPDGG